MREDLRDHSARSLPVVVVGDVRVAEGAAVFPGDGNWLDAPHVDLARRPFAISLWVNVKGAKPGYGLVRQYDSATQNRHLHAMLRGTLQPHLGFYINDSRAPDPLPRDRWIHLVFQYTGADQEIWVDGRRASVKAAAPFEGTSGVTSIGRTPRWSDVPSGDLEGLMRELRIYGRALSTPEIAALSAER
jgi:hypothetical protein